MRAYHLLDADCHTLEPPRLWESWLPKASLEVAADAEEVRRRFPDFDTRDVDRWVGVPLGGGQLRDPIAANDIRRWVQGMQNPNPLHYDDGFAAESRFGRLVAPQSFVVWTER